MFRSIGKKCLLILVMTSLVITGVQLSNFTQKTLRKEGELLASAGQSAASALDAMKETGEELVSSITKKQVTVLVTGIDSALGGSDVIMLVSLDSEAGNVRVLQIPRDTYIRRGGNGSHKINSVYAAAVAKARKEGASATDAAHEGNRALRVFLSHNFGIEIDHYVSVNTNGLSKIVDAAGGVTIDLPMDIDYDDNSQDLHIHLKKGTRHLSGREAVQFVRFRSGYKTADYGRMDAQKLFLAALFRKVKSDFTLPTLLKLATTCLSYTKSDLTAADLVPLIRSGLEISEDNVKMITLVGQTVKDENGVLCEVLSRPYTIDLICEYLLPRGSKASSLCFDPDGVFTASGKIDELYQSMPPFVKKGVSVKESSSIQIQ